MAKSLLRMDKRKRGRLVREVKSRALLMLWIPAVLMFMVFLGVGIDGYGYFVDILVFGFLGWGFLVLYYAASLYVKMLPRRGGAYGSIVKIFIKDLLCPFFAAMILVPPVLYVLLGDSPLADFGAIVSGCFAISSVASLVLALAVASINLYKTNEEVGPFTFFVLLSCTWFMPALLLQYVIFDVPFDLSVGDLFAGCMAFSVLVIFLMWLEGGLEKDGKLIWLPSW